MRCGKSRRTPCWLELTSVEGDGVLHEAIFNDTASEALLALIAGGGQIPSREGDHPRDPQ